jgi:probable HAF family extracellular repeat protein
MWATSSRRPFARAVALVAFFILISACGGGDGSKNTPPTAAFTVAPSSGVSPQPVTLDASASTDREGPIAAYAWNFGDGSAAGTGVTTNHVYQSSGSFTVTLTVTDRKGATATANRTIAVAANTPPTASFTATPSNGRAPLTVAFNASASSDPDGTIVRYEWTFGDGSSGSGSVTQHTYVTSGRFQVTLKVTDDRGGVGSSTASSIVMSGTAAEWYAVTEITGLCVVPTSVNTMGMVTGTYSSGGVFRYAHAFVFDGRNLNDLGTLGGTTSVGRDINDYGEVIGMSPIADGVEHAFLFTNGAMRDLGTLGGRWSDATAINNAGQVVGYSLDQNGFRRAFLYGNGQMRALATPGGDTSRADAINDKAVVAGVWSIGVLGRPHAFVNSGGIATDICCGVGDAYDGTLYVGSVRGINEANDVIGSWVPQASEGSTGFLYRDGVVRSLVPGFSDPFGINNAGVVVGDASFGLNRRAFVWDETKGLQDLNGLIDPTLGLTLTWATGINDLGQIVAVDPGVRGCDDDRAVLLTPAR